MSGFFCHVGICDLACGCGEVLYGNLEVVCGYADPGLEDAYFSPLERELIEFLLEHGKGLPGVCHGGKGEWEEVGRCRT